jgi:hypothetical protein
MTDRTLLQQALEALIKAHPYSNSNKDLDGHSEAIAALRERLAQPEQEPVAWVCYGASEKHDIDYFQDEVDAIPVGTQLYASPPAQRKPLKLREIEKCIYDANNDPIVACRNVEAAHGIKENT